MTQCEYCGNQSNEQHQYCPTCGAKLNHKPQPRPAPTVRPVTPGVARPGQPAGAEAKKKTSVAVVVGLCLLILMMISWAATPSSKSTRTRGGGTPDRQVEVLEQGPVLSIDLNQYDTVYTRFEQNPGDKDAILYLVEYGLYLGDTSWAQRCTEQFLEQQIKDDGDIYISLAELFRQWDQPQAAVWILQQGYELTSLDFVGNALQEYRPADFIRDDSLEKAVELMAGKGIQNITFEDMQQVQYLSISENGNKILYSKEPVEMANGRMESGTQHWQGLEQVLLDTPIRDYSELRLFGNLTVLALDNVSVDLEDLGDLYHLQLLRLTDTSGSQERKEVPSLPNLKGLSLTGKAFVSLVGLSDLEQLEHLSLSRTKVVDISGVQSLENLVSLSLSKNENITDVSALSGLTGLKELSLEDFDLVQLNMAAGMPELERLTIIDTQIKNMDFLSDLKNLTYLNLQSNKNLLTLPSLGGLSKLEELVVDCSNFSDRRSLDFLSGLQSVKRVTLLRTSDVGPVATMPQLEELTITYGGTLYSFAPIGSASNLKRLSMSPSMSHYSGIINMSFLSSLGNLEYLNMGAGGAYIEGNAIFTLPNLKYLALSKNTFVGDFSGISRLTGLEELHIDKMRFTGSAYEISDGFITSLYTSGDIPIDNYFSSIGQLKSLKTLSIEENKLDSISFLSGLDSLEHLYAAENYITQIQPVTGCADLSYLDMTNNPVNDWQLLDGNGSIVALGR